jgi:cation transport ATPase
VKYGALPVAAPLIVLGILVLVAGMVEAPFWIMLVTTGLLALVAGVGAAAGGAVAHLDPRSRRAARIVLGWLAGGAAFAVVFALAVSVVWVPVPPIREELFVLTLIAAIVLALIGGFVTAAAVNRAKDRSGEHLDLAEDDGNAVAAEESRPHRRRSWTG